MNSKQFLKEGFLEDAHEAHSDHEVQMARVDCYYAAEHAIVLHKLLRNISEEQGLEGWVASKITLANDYLKSVREHLEYQMMNVDAGEDDFLPLAEGLKPVKKNSVAESTAPVAEDEEEKFQDFERGPWYVIVKGNPVSVDGVPKKFNWLNGAKTYFRSMMDKNPEMAQKIKREYDEASDKKSVIYYTKNLPANNTTSTEQPVSESEKPGLWANIRAKRKRIKGGSGERMRKPGSKGAPSDKDLKSIRAASESTVNESDFHSQFAAMIDDMKKSGQLKTGGPTKSQAKYAPEPSRAELEARLRELESEFDPEYQYSDDYSFWTKQNAIAREIASIKKKLGSQGVAEGFKNTYSVGDRVDGPMGTGTIVAVSKNVNVDGRVKVKLDDPRKAGEDGKYKDSFVLTTTQLKHISEQGVAEGLSKQFEIIYREQNGDRKRKIVSGTSKEAAARQFKKQYKLEIEQVKELQQGVAEGENIGGERYDKIADLKGRTVDELNKLIQKLEGIVANYPDHPRTNEYLGLAKMIRAQKIGRKGVAEGSDNSVEAVIQVYNNRDQKIVLGVIYLSVNNIQISQISTTIF